ncbi:transcriptional regulator, ArsR family [Gemmobacter aquatilis]|uniref:Transcriptional regulator, ArsR family n=1 Tax=Gemmobacter aquatilis TaxID=933059 RepID=A0A1H8CG60_9RHOB|nr:metalloregulator ArsR/SmtB family transcription factor [Gemmobacter aquatilis]SEM94073.1 transcriptional regulator, ArsR family [Gemmobacter aquatilis]
MSLHDPDLDRIFQALGDPTRRALLARLLEGPAPVTVLAGPTGMALPTVLRHLAVLEAAGLIASEKRGRTRLCAVQVGALAATEHWLNRQRAIWEGRTDRLEALALSLEAQDDAVRPDDRS